MAHIAEGVTYRTYGNGIYHTPLGRFFDISTAVGIGSVPKKTVVGNIAPRAFRRRVVRYWHVGALLVVEKNRGWKNAPGRCDTTPSYTVKVLSQYCFLSKSDQTVTSGFRPHHSQVFASRSVFFRISAHIGGQMPHMPHCPLHDFVCQ